MNKLFIVAISILINISICSVSFSLSPSKEPLEGWRCDGTFKMAGYSISNKSIGDLYNRRLDSRDKAFMDAKNRTFDFFVQTRYSYRINEKIPADKKAIEMEIKNEFQPLIDRCVPEHDTYDVDGNCELFIYIRDKSLKNKICLGSNYNSFLDFIGWDN